METTRKRRKTSGRSVEFRENELISLSLDLAEKKIREGTASSQLITHFLKIGSLRERRELEKLERENELLRIKAESIERQDRIEELYSDAIKYLKRYRGDTDDEEDYYDS